MPAHRPSQSIRKTLPRLALVTFIVLLACILPLNIVIQTHSEHRLQARDSDVVFDQFEQLLHVHEADLIQDRRDYEERAIRAADTAALFLSQSNKDFLSHQETLRLAQAIDVDEIHYFSPKGVLVGGTHPKYVGYTFDTGEQMRFFLPMLKDRTLKLVQPVTPNTVEGLPMQYAAVWLSSGKGIVQIGFEPRRLLEDMKKKSLTKLVSQLPVGETGSLHIVDLTTGTFTSSTNTTLIGRSVDDVIRDRDNDLTAPAYHGYVNGNKFCLYTRPMGDKLLIRAFSSHFSMTDMITSTVLVGVYIALISIFVMALLTWYLNRKICDNLTAINSDMRRVEEGTLAEIERRTHVSELDELVFYFNQLLRSVKLSWEKLNFIIEKGKIPIGVLDVNRFYKKTFFNDRLLAILDLEPDMLPKPKLGALIETRLRKALEHVLDREEHIYRYDRGGHPAYLRIEIESDEQSDIYYVSDVTLWWTEIHLLRGQTNFDDLTALYNRRGFTDAMNERFASPEKIGAAAMVLIDADGLKRINDRYGHLVGDEYLIEIASVLKRITGTQAVAARLGGDEFALFLHGFEHYHELDRAIDVLREARGERFRSASLDVTETVEFSIGVALYPSDGQTYHDLLETADAAMYREKIARRKSRLTTADRHDG